MNDDRASHEEAFVVAGLGASAGGVEALEAFFAGLPEVDGVAFVVILHLAPEKESRLAEVLGRGLPLPVTQVTGSVAIEPGHVYVIPPNKNLVAHDGQLTLEPIETDRVQRRPVDHFFRTLAHAYGDRAVGVVLSGTGADGTVGVRALKEAGGLILAQEPADAVFDEMPQTAIASGVVDTVRPAGALAAEVVAYAHRLRRVHLPDSPAELPGDGQKALQGVLVQLRTRTGHDFSHYKRATVLRRLDRRLHVTGADSLAGYLGMLRENPGEAEALLDDLLISVTNFFRDPEAFVVLEQSLPQLFAGKGPNDQVRAWVAGCATGEEAYSVAMLLMEHASTLSEPPRVQVFATDLSDNAVRTGRAGVYPESIEADVSPERLRRFFTHESGQYRVSDPLREAVLFATHSLVVDPPFSRIDLFSCRNVLIYFQSELQERVLSIAHYAMRPGGLLFLGSSESTNSMPDLFSAVDKRARLFRRLDVETVALTFMPRGVYATPASAAQPEGDSPPQARSLSVLPAPSEIEQVHRTLRESSAPPSVLVGEGDGVLHVSGDAAPFLQVTTGMPSQALARLLQPELWAPAQTVLFQARRHGRPAASNPVVLDINGETRAVVVRARPTDGGSFVQIVFEVLSAPVSTPAVEDNGVLADALRQTQEQLQISVEEFETSREELRAQNEELMSINEELRSTAEELETSKEEAQSMSEELRTVNDELGHKVEETARAKGDLENLIASTEIATLFLDRQLRIQRFTPHVRELFHVLASDVGRPLSDLAQKFGGRRLVEDVEGVIARLEVTEYEVEAQDGQWYLVRARPYRTVDDHIDGVVVTFVNITRRKADESELRQSEERFRQVAQTVPDILFRASPDGQIDFVNHQYETFTGRSPETALGMTLSSLVHPDDRERTGAAWDEAREQSDKLQVSYRLLTHDGSLWVIMRARPLLDDEGTVTAWYGTITDVDTLIRTEAEVRQLNATLEGRVVERTGQVRKLSAQLTAAEMKERRRIAIVLHDDLQQQLAALAMVLMVLEGSPTPEKTQELQTHANSILTSAQTLTRSLASDLLPPSLATERLEEMLEWLAERMQELHHLDVIVEVSGACTVSDEELRALLYTALRELLFNVTKHAGTGQATVRARRDGSSVVVEVEDDGKGFDSTMRTPSKGGLGLFSVRERIEMAGGQFKIDSEPGRGTHVSITVPADGPSSPTTQG